MSLRVVATTICYARKSGFAVLQRHPNAQIKEFKSTLSPLGGTQTFLSSQQAKDFEKQIEQSPTPLQRLKDFPAGVKELVKDCRLYKNIHDASKTPVNAWTIQHPFRPHARGFFIWEGEIRPGRIPRRQYEQQRRLLADLRVVTPLVLAWIPPGFGLIPPLLAGLCPRQTLSRQFQNDFEVRTFAETEYRQRLEAFHDLGEFFWSMTDPRFKQLCMNSIMEGEMDSAGPIVDPMVLFSVFASSSLNIQTASGDMVPRPDKHIWSVDGLPREYLAKMCLSIGVHQHLPGWISPAITELTVSWWLRKQVTRLSKIVTYDDALLLEEGHNADGCAQLTDVEVMDACLMRSLPVVTANPSAMRMCLTNHLKMISIVKRQMNGPITEGFRLFTMHLAPIRAAMMRDIQ